MTRAVLALAIGAVLIALILAADLAVRRFLAPHTGSHRPARVLRVPFICGHCEDGAHGIFCEQRGCECACAEPQVTESLPWRQPWRQRLSARLAEVRARLSRDDGWDHGLDDQDIAGVFGAADVPRPAYDNGGTASAGSSARPGDHHVPRTGSVTERLPVASEATAGPGRTDCCWQVDKYGGIYCRRHDRHECINHSCTADQQQNGSSGDGIIRTAQVQGVFLPLTAQSPPPESWLSPPRTGPWVPARPRVRVPVAETALDVFTGEQAAWLRELLRDGLGGYGSVGEYMAAATAKAARYLP